MIKWVWNKCITLGASGGSCLHFNWTDLIRSHNKANTKIFQVKKVAIYIDSKLGGWSSAQNFSIAGRQWNH